jgi:hypothetical protein
MIENLKIANQHALGQLIDVLERLPTEVYQTRLGTLHNHSVGQHARHIIEFYQCLLADVGRPSVCYDARLRDARIESDGGYALACAQAQVARLGRPMVDRHLWVESHSHTEAIGSSLARELTYLIEHTIHHLAIIKIGLNHNFPEINLPDNLGVAPSTLDYRAKLAATA